MSKNIKIHFSEEELQDLQEGKVFDWIFETEEGEGEFLYVKLLKSKEDEESI